MATHLADEADLIAKARRGDHEAFAILTNQYYQSLFRLALKITGNREDAEDVTQDALLKSYCNLEQFRANSRFYTWLVRITVNQALMQLRKKRSERELAWADVFNNDDGESARLQEPQDTQPSPEARSEGMEIRGILIRALMALGPRLRTVFTLRSVDDLSTRETAEMLGLSVAAVKSRVLRARTKLRRDLTGVLEREPCTADGG